jgi:hypothetical protein
MDQGTVVEQTIKEVSEATGISRFTLAQVAKKNRLGGAARQSGTIWLIDTEHADFKTWLDAHWQQSRVKGKKTKRNG